MTKNIRRNDWETLEPTFCGFGVNDVNYTAVKWADLPRVDGKRRRKCIWQCPYYIKWVDMIKRCYGESALKKRPTYQDCNVCEEWRYLSNFIEWVDKQPNKDWQNCSLDKDFLIVDNRVYGPETAVFISKELNSFIVSSSKIRGKYMIGVCYRQGKTKNPYLAQCQDPFGNNGYHIGYYPTELEAHKAWQERKHQYACALANLQDDPRLAKALRDRYSPDKDWTKR